MKKISICLFLIIALLMPMIYGIVSAQEEEQQGITYTVEQVTSTADINSNNLYDYILVYEREDGTNVALASVRGGTSNTYPFSRSNFVEVTLEDGKITKDSSNNILWQFSKSNVSVLEDGEPPVIRSAVPIASGVSSRDLKITATAAGNSDGGYAGMRFVESGNGFSFDKNDDNTFKIHENNADDPEGSYISFTTYFCKGTEENAVGFKIYRIVKKYNYESSKFLSSEQIAQMENVTVTKDVSEYVSYGDTGIAQVKLKTKGTSLEKVCDIILILDDSTSVYDAAPEHPDKTRAQVIREDALSFSQKILETNPENRISVIKFGSNVTNEPDVDAIGFSSNIDEIGQMIGGDKAEVSYGTDYSAAFRKANEVFEAYSDPDHGKVVLFISDGLPSTYNGIHYTTYENTGDADGVATNWINYLKNTPLQEAELMAQTGTAIYTIGSLEEETSIDHSTGWLLPAQTTKDVLSQVATEGSNFYDFDKIETELEQILFNLAKEFNYYPTDAVVNDKISADIALLDKKVNEVIPEIIFKRNGEEVERIIFNDEGTEAHSSLLGDDVNILKTVDGKTGFEGKFITFDGSTLRWNIGDLFRDEFELDYYIYLKKAANLNGDGDDLPTGTYPTTDTATLTYTDVTNKPVEEEAEKPTLNWVNPKQPENPTGGGAPGGGTPGGGGQGGSVIQNIYNGLLPKTGSASAFIITAIGVALVAIAVRMRMLAKTKKSKRR